MKGAPERGLVLLPVALALAVTGALAWAMVREGAMDASAVDQKYQNETARYLAEAGLRLVAWQNQQIKCGGASNLGSVSLPGGTVTVNSVKAVSGGLSIDVSATTTSQRGTARISRALVPVYDKSKRLTVTYHGKTSVNDAWLVPTPPGNTPTPLGTTKNYMQLTDGAETGVVEFIIPLSNILMVEATMQLRQNGTHSDPAVDQTIYMHRVTKNWDETKVVWEDLIRDDGTGDFVDAAAAVMPINNQNTYFSTRIDNLADSWIKLTLPNYGVLLTSTGLNQAKFGASEDDAKSPKLILDYYLRCK